MRASAILILALLSVGFSGEIFAHDDWPATEVAPRFHFYEHTSAQSAGEALRKLYPAGSETEALIAMLKTQGSPDETGETGNRYRFEKQSDTEVIYHFNQQPILLSGAVDWTVVITSKKHHIESIEVTRYPFP